MNGDEVSIWTTKCRVLTKSHSGLSDIERRTISGVYGAASMAGTPGRPINRQLKYSSIKYSNGKLEDESNFNNEVTSSVFETNGYSVHARDDGFSVSKPAMLDNLAQLFVISNIVTFVQLDGRVRMVPKKCLDPKQQDFVEQVSKEVSAGSVKFGQDSRRHQDEAKTARLNHEQKRQSLRDDYYKAKASLEADYNEDLEDLEDKYNAGISMLAFTTKPADIVRARALLYKEFMETKAELGKNFKLENAKLIEKFKQNSAELAKTASSPSNFPSSRIYNKASIRVF